MHPTEGHDIPGVRSRRALGVTKFFHPDEPGVVAVVIFPDNAFKYTSSFQRHLPDLFPAESSEPVAPANPFAAHLEAAFEFAKQGPDVIDARQAKQLQNEGATLLDVRNPDEVERSRVLGSANTPLAALSQGSASGLPDDKDAPVVTICAAGTRSIYALLLLKAQGYRNVKSVNGGFAAWEAAGLPVE